MLDELCYYTLSHPDPGFIHQHVVDAYTAQTADDSSKPIAVTFALIGLYLYVEKGFTGKQVQHRHVQLAKRKQEWLKLPVPAQRGAITVREVLAIPAGTGRDEMIREWCVSVWDSWNQSRPKIVALVERLLAIR